MLKRYLGVLLLTAVAGSALAAAGLNTGRYAVILSDSSVAQHVASLKGARGAATADYRRQVVASQAALRQELENRSLRVTGSAQTLLNAVFVVASKDQAAQLRALPGVQAVVPLHRYRLRLDKAVQLTNVPAAWAQLGGTTNAGAGVKIAIIDNGIDQNHPGFQDTSLRPPAGFPKCDLPANCAFTNNKVIVARSYVAILAAGTQPNPAADSSPDDLSPRDHMGHGTALAMIAAGVTNTGPGDTITGVAPKAFLGSYKVFGSPGVHDYTYGDAVILALEDALNDGMDIAVMSFGSPAFSGPLDVGAICGETGSNPCDPEAAAVEAAIQSGMMVVAAAGNDGDTGYNLPTLSTISTPATAPSAIAVGASTNSHTFGPSVEVPGQNVPQNLQTISAQLGDGPVPAAPLTAPLRDVTALDPTGFACSALPASSLNGMIVLIVRSQCTFATKVLNAQAAGAVGVIVIQTPGQGAAVPPGFLSGTLIPTVMIGDSDGQALKSYLASHPGLNGTIDPTLRPVDLSVYNEVASFSSHGPSIDMRLKPEVVAVGTNMYMATQRFDPNGEMYDPSGYTVADGTSFATPMIAGALALVKQAHPSFTPWQLKSAVVNTATQDLTEYGGAASVVAAGNGKMSAGDAIQAVVTVNPSTISFGALVKGTPPAPQTLTIHYSGTSAASLTLAAVAVNGAPPTLNRTILPVVPGQADATVTLTLPASIPAAGIYEGGILIQGAGATLRVPYLYVVGDGVPSDLVAVGGGFDGTVGQTIPTGPFLLKLIDSYGVPVPGWRVAFRRVSGGGTIFNADTQTDSEGVAGAEATLGPSVGTQVFSVNITNFGSITFSGAARVQPTIAGVANSANYAVVGVPVSPGSYITLWGSGLSDYTGGATTAALPLAIVFPDPSGNFIDYNVSVSFDVPSANLSLPGRMLYASFGQVNVQVPWELAGQSSVLIKVTVGDSLGQVFTAQVANYSPAVYLADQATKQAAALDLNAALISTQNPAHPGQTIQLYLNGLGAVTNPPAIGFVAQAQPLSETLVRPTVTIGGKAASVLFSGLTPTESGLYQINLQLAPDTPKGAQPLVVSIGGISSTAANIVVQ